MFRSLQPSLSFHYSIGEHPQPVLQLQRLGPAALGRAAPCRAGHAQPTEPHRRNPRSRRQSYTHSVSLGYYHTDTKSSRSVGFDLSADLTVRDIATRQRFFAEDTPLEQYGGYVAPKGSTLTTPVNVNGSGSVQANGQLLDSAQAAEVGSELHGRHRIQPPALVYRKSSTTRTRCRPG